MSMYTGRQFKYEAGSKVSRQVEFGTRQRVKMKDGRVNLSKEKIGLKDNIYQMRTFSKKHKNRPIVGKNISQFTSIDIEYNGNPKVTENGNSGQNSKIDNLDFTGVLENYYYPKKDGNKELINIASAINKLKKDKSNRIYLEKNEYTQMDIPLIKSKFHDLPRPKTVCAEPHALSKLWTHFLKNNEDNPFDKNIIENWLSKVKFTGPASNETGELLPCMVCAQWVNDDLTINPNKVSVNKSKLKFKEESTAKPEESPVTKSKFSPVDWSVLDKKSSSS